MFRHRGLVYHSSSFFRLKAFPFCNIKEQKSLSPQVLSTYVPDAEIPEKMKVSKVMTMMGICSRREAEKLIKLGKVEVGNTIVKNVATRVFPFGVGIKVDSKQVC